MFSSLQTSLSLPRCGNARCRRSSQRMTIMCLHRGKRFEDLSSRSLPASCTRPVRTKPTTAAPTTFCRTASFVCKTPRSASTAGLQTSGKDSLGGRLGAWRRSQHPHNSDSFMDRRWTVRVTSLLTIFIRPEPCLSNESRRDSTTSLKLKGWHASLATSL